MRDLTQKLADHFPDGVVTGRRVADLSHDPGFLRDLQEVVSAAEEPRGFFVDLLDTFRWPS